MKIPETSQEVAIPQANSKPRTAILKWLRKAVSFLPCQALPQADIAHGWKEKPNFWLLPMEEKRRVEYICKFWLLGGIASVTSFCLT